MTVDINNTFNSCSHLVEQEDKIQQFLKENEHKTTLELVFTKQLQLQKYLEDKEGWYMSSFDPSIKKDQLVVRDLIRFCKLHFDREYFELEDSLGGMSRGLKVASSIAKPWKAIHNELRDFKFNDLSEDDKNEIHMEYIDMLHFLAMYGLALGIDLDALHQHFMKTYESYSSYVEDNEYPDGDIMKILLSITTEYASPETVTCGRVLYECQLAKFDIDTTHVDMEYHINNASTVELYALMIFSFAFMGKRLGLTNDDIKYLYTRKNLENFDRQERGY